MEPEPEPEPPGAAFFCLEPEPEPTQVGQSRSRSRLRDLGDLEPELEPPKKVAAPQHWLVYADVCTGLEK